jgi:hypothetical protein
MKERTVGFFLLCALIPLAVLGYWLLVWIGFFGPNARGRAGVRALDHFVNATIFNGYAWESISSHAWRERDKRWAKVVIRITDKLQPGHCQRANKREQAVVDLVRKSKLDSQTIF